jgi:hypothetical protein
MLVDLLVSRAYVSPLFACFTMASGNDIASHALFFQWLRHSVCVETGSGNGSGLVVP